MRIYIIYKIWIHIICICCIKSLTCTAIAYKTCIHNICNTQVLHLHKLKVSQVELLHKKLIQPFKPSRFYTCPAHSINEPKIVCKLYSFNTICVSSLYELNQRCTAQLIILQEYLPEASCHNLAVQELIAPQPVISNTMSESAREAFIL